MRNAQLDDPTLFGNVYDDYAKHIDGVQSGMGVIDVVEELDVEKDFKSIDTALYTRIISLIDLVMHHSASLDYKASTTVAAALYVFCRRELRFDSDPKENGMDSVVRVLPSRFHVFVTSTIERICIDFIFKYTYHSVDDIENCIELVEDVYDQKYVHEDMPAFSGLVSDAAIRRLDPPAPNSAQQSHARQFTKSQRPATRSSTNSAGGGAAGKMQPGCVDFANNSRMVEHKARFYFQTQYCDLPNYLQRGV